MQSVNLSHGHSVRFLWCIWLGAVLGGLYLLDYSEPYDSVSQARAYGFAALGALMELWLCSLPYIRRAILRVRRSIRRAVWAFGMALTVALGALESLRLYKLLLTRAIRLGDAASLHSTLDPNSISFGAFNTPVSRFLTDVTNLVDSYEPFLSCLLAFVCLLCGQMSGIFGTVDGGPVNVGQLSRPDKGKLCPDRVGIPIVYIIAFLFGTVRAWAWSVFLPGPSFPVPIRDVVYMSTDLWVEVVPALSVVPAFLMGAFAWLALKTGQPGFIPILAADCIGSLFSQVLKRIWPNTASISLALAVGCCVLQLSSLAMLAIIAYRNTQAAIKDASDVPQSLQARTQTAKSGFATCVSAKDANLLAALGLTSGELNAVRAAVLGLSSSEAAQVLGVQPSTIRVWRTRVCSKLGVANINQLAIDLIRRTGIFSAKEPEARKNHTEDGSASNARYRTAPTVCMISGALSCGSLILLPYGRLASIWEVSGFMAIGCALGLGITLIVQALIPHDAFSHKRQTSTLVFAAVALALPLAAIALLYLDVSVANSAVALPLKRGALVTSTACCTSFFCYGFASIIGSIHTHRALRRSLVPAVFISAAINGCACMGDFAWVAAILASWVLLCIGAMVSTMAKNNRGANTARPFPFPFTGCGSLGTLLIAGCIGFAWEEIWRGDTYKSLQWACAPLLIVVSLLYIWRCRRLGCPISLPISICAGCIPVAYATGACAALLFACGLSVFSFACMQQETECHTQDEGRIWHSPLFTLAAGMCAGMYIINVLGTNLLRFSSFTSQGSQVLERMVFGAVFLLSFAIALIYAASAAGKVYAKDGSVKGTGLTGAEQLYNYFRSRGLTPLQVKVVSILAEGKSSSYAAESLGYSRSVIDRARREAFSRLGVHSRLQLVKNLIDDNLIQEGN